MMFMRHSWTKKHAKFTDAKAKISRDVGGKFEAYDGTINGKNLELVPDKNCPRMVL